MDLALVLDSIRNRAVDMAQGGWSDLGNILDSALPNPLNPFALLPIATGTAVGGNIDDLIPVASAITLIDMALRIVDDSVDQDDNSALFHKIGVNRALNVAMALNTIATRELAYIQLPPDRFERVINGYFRAFLQVTDGQDQDLQGHATTLSQYQDIVRSKTVAAYEFASVIGAYVATSDTHAIARCSQCGIHLGWMTQILNDIAGLWFPLTKHDKEVRKLTFPVLVALSMNHPNAQKLKKHYRAKDYDRPQILALLDDMNIRTVLMTQALDHRDKALDALGAPLNLEGQAILQHWLNWFLSDGVTLLNSQT